MISSASTTMNPHPSKQTLTDKLMTMVGMPTSTSSSDKILSIDDEIVLFCQSIQRFKGDFSSFWVQQRSRFTRLHQIAQRVNIIPATSVASESVFSIAGFVARKQRTSLTSNSLRYLMVLKESRNLDALRPTS